MSAIWGAISLNNTNINKKTVDILKSGYEKCVIDRVEEIIEDNIYIACGIQYFNREAEKEKLPIKTGNVYFTGDIILDNRSELRECLGGHVDSDIPDGKLYQLVRAKLGNKADDIMVGAYATLQYDSDNNEIMMVADAVGYRFIHYMVEDGIFYFSSLLEPLVSIKKKKKANYNWIANYISQDNYNMYLECSETPYEGIYRTEPAERIIYRNGKFDKTVYWDPTKKVKKIRLRNDDEYRKEFRTLYQECVTGVMRSDEISILLSGGFDSTSVAVLAAPYLEAQGKKLHAFTSVPYAGFSDEGDKWTLNDETELVKITAKKYPNIECNFMDLPDMNGWYDRLEYIPIAEQPYKSPQNLIWMYRASQLSAKSGAKVILSGAFGNGTVSFDNTKNYYSWLFSRLKWRTLWSEINAMARKGHFTRKSILVTAIKDAIGIDNQKLEFKANPYVNVDWLAKYDAINTINTKNKIYAKTGRNYRIFRNSFLERETFRHYGEFAQRNSLYTGVILRDPSKDRRMIEFVYGIPYDQFTHQGIRRRLIREYMDDLMPAEILNERRQGRQSADVKERICRDETIIKNEWIERLETHTDNEIIAVSRMLEDIKKTEIHDMQEFEIVRYIYTILFLDYCDRYEK